MKIEDHIKKVDEKLNFIRRAHEFCRNTNKPFLYFSHKKQTWIAIWPSENFETPSQEFFKFQDELNKRYDNARTD